MNQSTSMSAPLSESNIFGPGDIQLAIQRVTAARAVLRTVALAVDAQLDASMAFDNNGVERWQPVVELAVYKLSDVRDMLIHKSAAPALDWFTPLGFLEAISGALWHGNACAVTERLEHAELSTAARIAIELLDSLMLVLEKEGTSHV